MDDDRANEIPLTGWKEIANHLRVTVRTAQLWEKQRGLPVRRYPGDGKPRVYALPHELEAWLGASEGGAGAEAVETPPDAPLGRPVRWLAALGLALSAAVALWIWTSSRGSNGDLVRCEIRERAVLALDDGGGTVWQKRLADEGGASPESPLVDHCMLTDADLDGVPEVYAWYLDGDRFANGGPLVRLDATGDESWRLAFGKPLRHGERSFSPAFSVKILRELTIAGSGRLLVVARQHPYYPAEVALVDPRSGETVDRYFHPGVLYAVAFADVDHDGAVEVLLGGINNPGPGSGRPVLVVLDLPFSGEDGSRRLEADFFDNPGPRELAYYVLPRADLDDLTSAQSSVTEVGAPRDDAVALVVHSVNGEVTYAIDLTDLSRPVVTSAVPSTEFRETHDRVFAEGRLDHRLGATMPERYYRVGVCDTAPDGNAPEGTCRPGSIHDVP